MSEPRVDLHGHAGRCFLAGLPAGRSALGTASVTDALRAARAAGMTAVNLSRFGRDVVAECNRLGIVVDCAHATFGTTMAVLEASSQPVIISHGQLGHDSAGHPHGGHPRLMTAGHAAAVAEAGGLIGAWPCGFTSRSLADFGTEILRLTEAVGPDRVALGTDLDGNYRPVLTRYDQLEGLTSLLRDAGLPPDGISRILGSSALDLLHRVL